MCSVNSFQRITAFPSRSLSITQLLWNLQSLPWKPLQGYGENGNILR
ncbi:nef attachable domain protein [Chlamydia psittaci C1/97]|nr:nef attachable domain protein [Chlamydia psittaci C1/97]